MTRPASGALRAVRAGLLAAAFTAVSAFSHATAGAPAPSAGSLVAVAALAAVAFAVLFRRARAGHRQLVLAATAVAALQASGHVAFGHVGFGRVTAGLPGGHGGRPSLTMLAAHAVAAALLLVLVMRGDAALSRLVRLVARVLVPGVVPAAWAHTVPVARPLVRRDQGWGADALARAPARRRGPPAAAAA